LVEALPPRGSLSSVLPKIELCWNLVPTKVLKRVVLSAINSVGTSQDEKMDRFCYHVPRVPPPGKRIWSEKTYRPIKSVKLKSLRLKYEAFI